MKRVLSLLITCLFTIAALPGSASAGVMEDYCSAPPYVTRSIPPNIMILLDNSCDMLNSAYDHSAAYSPATIYSGYFIPDAYYYGGTQNRFYVVEQNVASTEPYLKTNYTVTDPGSGQTQTFDIVFKGNFMNWMTMSRFDLLQKILIGGNSPIPRGSGGDARIRSMSGAACAGAATTWEWVDTATSTSSGCKFVVDGGQFRIVDVNVGSCGLLNGLVAQAPKNTFFAAILKKLRLLEFYEAVMAKLRGSVRYFARSFEDIEVVRTAHAAVSVAIDTAYVLTKGVVELDYSQLITATTNDGDEPFTHTFEVTTGQASLPPGLTLGASCTTATTDPGSCSVALSGVPTTAGIYYFTVQVTSRDSRMAGSNPNPRVISTSKDFVITISQTLSPDVTITTSTLPSGVVTTTFFNTTASNIPDPGFVESTINVTGLPATDDISTLALVRVNISHTNDSNLKIYLKSPSGSEIILSANRGGTGDNYLNTGFGTPLNASTPISLGMPPFKGVFLPEQSLSSLSGTVNGAWTLRVVDETGADTGKLNMWYLTFSPTGATYVQTLTASASGGTGPYTYTWSLCTDPNIECRTTGLPPGLSLSSDGEISGAPTSAGIYQFTVRVDVKDANNVSIGYTIKDLSIAIYSPSGKRVKAYDIIIDVGDDIFGGALPAELAEGLIQKYWEKAKWGITNFEQVGRNIKVKVNECVGSNNETTFLNSVNNAVPSNVELAPLAKAYYGVVRYFQQQGVTTGNDPDYVSGCQDPFQGDNVPCRKNFILSISSAYDISGLPERTFSQPTSDCPTVNGNSSAKLVQNACYGYVNDQRHDPGPPPGLLHVDGEQKLYHYAVYTFGKDNEPSINDISASTTDRLSNKQVFEDSARAGGPVSHFYDASQGASIQAQLMKAIEDILSQAASGTAVSVLTTSSRGIGSMVQAYFLPSTLEETREVSWTGYLQNLWIDPWDNLREDTYNDLKLIPGSAPDSNPARADGDNVVKLFFDLSTNETKAATFTTKEDGTGGSLGSCSAPESAIKPFDQVTYLWEAGKRLALRKPSTRNIFTSKLVTRTTLTDLTGTTITLDATANHSEPSFDTNMDAGLKTALVPNATYTSDGIINYIRGQCLETGTASQDANCNSTGIGTYRDRRLKIYSSPTSTITLASAKDASEADAHANGNVWKLGDIISSTPKVLANSPLNTYHIDYGDSTYYAYVTDSTESPPGYKKRPSIAFVGANDGMVHAFQVGYLKDDKASLDSWVKGLFKDSFNAGDSENSSIGKELWAYIPYNAFPYLKYLADPAYCHIYYNDLSLRLVDASLGCKTGQNDCKDPDDPLHKDNWHTILVGGMRFGGACAGSDADPVTPPDGSPANVGFSSYFAIDITNPMEPVPLWEFSDADMGYATTFPSVLRTGGNNVNGNWYVAIGSGSKQLPKSVAGASRDIARNSTGHVYLLNLQTGQLVRRIDLDHPGIVGDILAIDADKDYHSEMLYFGTSYNTTGTWQGKVVSISIPNETLTSTSAFTTTYLFAGNYPFTASPDAAKDPAGTVWVYAGSGKYYTDLDETDTTQQVFLGMKHSGSITYPAGTGDLSDKTLFETKGDVTGTAQVCAFDDSDNTFGMQTVVTSVKQTSSAATIPDVGWYLKLMTSPRAERVISRPLAVGGLVDFLTYMPSASVCAYGGDSYLYSVGYTTGEAPVSVAIRSSRATKDGATSGNVTVLKGIKLGPGAPPTGEAIIIPPPKEGQESLKKKIQIATGVIIEAENSPVQSVISKIMHWLKK